MLVRLSRFLTAVLIAGCALAPVAYAASADSAQSHGLSTTDAAMNMLSAIESVRVGADATVVTIKNGAKSHPIVIEYAQALESGVPGVNANGEPTRKSSRSGSVPGTAPKGLSLGQIAGWLLGLTLVSRVLRIARQLAAVRG